MGQLVGNAFIQVMFSFTYALVLSPWNDPIYFIVWLVLLELAYILLLPFDPMVQLGVIVAYILGWIFGRQLFECYFQDVFVCGVRPWLLSEKGEGDWIGELTSSVHWLLPSCLSQKIQLV